MSFGQKIKAALANFMRGRHGTDNLGMFTLVTGLVLSVVSMFMGAGTLGTVFSTLGLALYIITLFRMFSRNHEKRQAENRKYIDLTGRWKTKFRQWKKRMQNRKNYKYFKCPKCKAMLRLTRGCGEKEITCPRCQNQFKQKA